MDTRMASRNWWAPIPLPDPERATTVVKPEGEGAGFWAGAPSAIVADGTTYLAYRMRRPRSQGRGGQNIVARSLDGKNFETLTIMDKADFETESMERPTLVALPEGGWRLYVSYVDPADQRWRIDVLEAEDPSGFDPARRRKVLTADDIGGEAVKDPVIVRVGSVWHMWASYLPKPERHIAELHDSADAYTTGAVRSLTGYATSIDGIEWEWWGTALAGREGKWDEYCARISCVLLDGPVPVAYYDGGSSVEENYEERTGVAFGTGLSSFRGVGGEPAATSPHASESLRYLSVLPVEDGYRMYYELARPDGAHELCTELAAPAKM